MPTPAELKLRELESMRNRSEQQNLPIPSFQLEPFPVEFTRAFPTVDGWLKRQNQRLAEHTKKMNVVLVPQTPQT